MPHESFPGCCGACAASRPPVLNGELAIRAIEVCRHQGIDGPGHRAPCPDVGGLRLHAFERRRVLPHEIFRPRDAGEVDENPACGIGRAACRAGRVFQLQCLGRPLFVRSMVSSPRGSGYSLLPPSNGVTGGDRDVALGADGDAGHGEARLAQTPSARSTSAVSISILR